VLEHLLHRAPADAAALVPLGDHEPPQEVALRRLVEGEDEADGPRIQCPGVKWASAIETAFGATNERWSTATSSSQIVRTVSEVISRRLTSIWRRRS
jgi:hypothetical protein